MSSGRTQAESSDKLKEQGLGPCRASIRSLSIKSSPLAWQAHNLPGPIYTCMRYATASKYSLLYL